MDLNSIVPMNNHVSLFSYSVNEDITHNKLTGLSENKFSLMNFKENMSDQNLFPSSSCG